MSQHPPSSSARDSHSDFHCKRLVIIGVGLMGGSLALALRARQAVTEIVGVGRNTQTSKDNLAQARALGVIDRVCLLDDSAAFAQACAQAEIIVLAVPVAQTEHICRQLAPHLQSGTIVTDVGSTKQDVIAAAQLGLAEKFCQFVPAHPIAGSEKNGVQAARLELYQDRHVILCPTAQNQPRDVTIVQALWAATGARLKTLDAAQHDAVFASVSHLPHLLAFAFMNHLLAGADTALKLEVAGTGFRDFSRIAGGDPTMWADIALANRAALLNELTAYQTQLQQLALRLQENRRDELLAWLQAASQARRDWKL